MKMLDEVENSWSFTELAEATVAYRACFDVYGQEDTMTKSIAEVVHLAIETNSLPCHYFYDSAVEDLKYALELHAGRVDVDPWQCAQAAFMLKLVLAPSNSLQ